MKQKYNNIPLDLIFNIFSIQGDNNDLKQKQRTLKAEGNESIYEKTSAK